MQRCFRITAFGPLSLVISTRRLLTNEILIRCTVQLRRLAAAAPSWSLHLRPRSHLDAARYAHLSNFEKSALSCARFLSHAMRCTHAKVEKGFCRAAHERIRAESHLLTKRPAHAAECAFGAQTFGSERPWRSGAARASGERRRRRLRPRAPRGEQARRNLRVEKRLEDERVSSSYGRVSTSAERVSVILSMRLARASKAGNESQGSVSERARERGRLKARASGEGVREGMREGGGEEGGGEGEIGRGRR
eukprot:1876078-Pleurochrysis_carterae.AAC.7